MPASARAGECWSCFFEARDRGSILRYLSLPAQFRLLTFLPSKLVFACLKTTGRS